MKIAVHADNLISLLLVCHSHDLHFDRIQMLGDAVRDRLLESTISRGRAKTYLYVAFLKCSLTVANCRSREGSCCHSMIFRFNEARARAFFFVTCRTFFFTFQHGTFAHGFFTTLHLDQEHSDRIELIHSIVAAVVVEETAMK